MIRTYDFLAPSLHPNTLVDVAIPEPGPSSLDPIVRHLPIKHGEHQAVGGIKRMHRAQDGHLLVADDAFRISTLSLEASTDGEGSTPTIVAQEEVAHRAGDVWSGLIGVEAGTISALTSGLLTFHPHASSSTASSSRTVSSPLLALSSQETSSTTFALAGKEVDVGVWDVETTFSGSAESASASSAGKRKKNELERGQIWRAKNMPNNSLALRPPNHHLCLTHLPLKGPSHLASGTKSGTIRTFDTRQRKPVHEWKAAREGGVGCISPGQDEHEIFFSDRANLLGALDLRTGRLLYSYPKMSCTAHHLFTLPPSDSSRGSNIRLSSISSDAGLRIHSTLPPKQPGEKGNLGNGRKAQVEGMVGGVGIGSFVWKGFGEMEDKPAHASKDKVDGEGDDAEDDDEEDDEEVWDGMSEVEDEGDSSEEDEPASKKKPKK